MDMIGWDPFEDVERMMGDLCTELTGIYVDVQIKDSSWDTLDGIIRNTVRLIVLHKK